MQKVPTVFYIDDDATLRDVVASLLARDSLPCATYESAEHFLAQFDPNAPGTVLADLRLPGMGGIELVEHLRGQNDLVPVILVSGFATIPTVVDAMKLGAVDFLEKPFDTASLVAAVRVGFDWDARIRAGLAQRGPFLKRLVALTDRERELLDLVVMGKASKQIAAQLGISTKTVENHRAHILKKTGALSASDLVRIVIHAAGSPEPVRPKSLMRPLDREPAYQGEASDVRKPGRLPARPSISPNGS